MLITKYFFNKNWIKKIINPYLIAFVILFLSITPDNNFTDFNVFPISNLDKIIHFIIYFSLSFSILFWYYERSSSQLMLNIIAFFSATAYGVLMESLQFLSNLGRSASFLDFLANEMGIIFGLLIFELLIRLK